MLKCREIVTRADEYLAGTLTPRQRLAMRLHLMMCMHCSRFIRQFRFLLRAVPFMHPPASEAEVERVLQAMRRREYPGDE